MTARPLRTVVVGAGGHARVVLSILRTHPQVTVIGVVAPSLGSIRGLPLLGGDEDLASLPGQGIEAAFVAVGDNGRRMELFGRCLSLGFELVNAIHPAAVIDRTVRLGRGVAIMPGAVINCDAVIGDAAIVNTSASVDHDCVIGPGSHVAPGAHLSGYVALGAGVLVGIGASVGLGAPIAIGDGAVIGAGAAALRDVPAGVTVAGLPAEQLERRLRVQGIASA